MPGWGLGEAGTLPLPSNPPARAWPPRGREDRLLGLTVTASSRPNPRPAEGPGGDSGAWQRGIWTRPRPPLPLRRRGFGRAGGLISLPWDSPLLPGMPRSQEPPGVPRPDFAIGGGPALGAPRNASCSRSLRWVRPPPRAAGEGPRAGRPDPGERGRPAGGQGVGDRGAAWGVGSPPGRRFVAATVLARARTWRKLELRARWPRAVRAQAPGGPAQPPGCSGWPGGGKEVGAWVCFILVGLELNSGEGTERERDRQTDTGNYPSYTKKEKLLLKHRGGNTHKETLIQTDPRETRKNSRSSYTFTETHSNAQAERNKAGGLGGHGQGEGKGNSEKGRDGGRGNPRWSGEETGGGNGEAERNEREE